MSREAKKNEAEATPTGLVWDPAPDVRPEPSEERRRPARRAVLWASATVLVLGGSAVAVYELGFHGNGTAAAGSARSAQSVRVVTSSGTPLPSASATDSSSDSAGTGATPVASPTMTVANRPVTVTTPAAQTGESATRVSGSIQCQSEGVEGVWIQAANGGSGWAPWVSSAAYPSYASYSYTLPYGGEYSVTIGCGGTPKAWAKVEYSSFYGGTVNNFYCYDEPSASLYSYCRESS